MNEIANIADDVRAPFEVKVSVDQGTTYGQDKQMKSYHCAVDQNSYRLNEVNEILSSMWANTTMKEWVMGLPAYVFSFLSLHHLSTKLTSPPTAQSTTVSTPAPTQKTQPPSSLKPSTP